MRVSPSGLLPSDLRRPDGSLAAGMLAADSARQMRSFSPWCRADRPVPPLHERPCRPLASTDAPHGHWCGSQMLAPSRSPTAMCMALSSTRGVVHSLTVAVRVASRRCVVPSPPTAVPCWRYHSDCYYYYHYYYYCYYYYKKSDRFYSTKKHTHTLTVYT